MFADLALALRLEMQYRTHLWLCGFDRVSRPQSRRHWLDSNPKATENGSYIYECMN